MLLELIDEKIEILEALDVERDAEVFAQQVLERNPEPFRGIPRAVSDALADDTPGEPAARLGALVLARAQLRLVREIPEHVREFLDLIHSDRSSPHANVALLGALAYLVQPCELIPDDAPGGYGYIDDCIVLKTMRLALDRLGIPLAIERARELRALSLLALALGPADFRQMQTLVTRTWNEIHLLHMMPTHVANAQAQHIFQRPLDVSYDWSTPMPSITRDTPTLRHGSFGRAEQEGIIIDFHGGGAIHMTPHGDVLGYE